MRETLQETVNRLFFERGLDRCNSLDDLCSLDAWPGLPETARILADHISLGNKIMVHGDYDADGVTSTAVFLSFLRDIDYPEDRVSWFIPDRENDGFGVTANGVKAILAFAPDLAVTVDCGISDPESIKTLKQNGISVLVTDHHPPLDHLPEADGICDPALAPRSGMALAGVGVIFMVLCAVRNILAARGFYMPDMRKYLDFVALGTVADVVPLSGQNRILVKNGVRLLSRGCNTGIAALKEAAGLSARSEIKAVDIAFTLAPRINSAGRMTHASEALALLMETDPLEASQLAQKLDFLNRKRKELEARIFAEAENQMYELGEMNAYILHRPDWFQGVVGIVASHLAEKYGKPFLVASGSGECRFSGRSPDISLRDAMAFCPSKTSFGGHNLAGGGSFREEKLDSLRHEFDEACSKIPRKKVVSRRYHVDALVPMRDFNLQTIKILDDMEPCGEGNPAPVFQSEKMTLESVSNEKRLVMRLRDGQGDSFEVIQFKPPKVPEETDIGRHLYVSYRAGVNTFRGKTRVDLRLVDWAFAD